MSFVGTNEQPLVTVDWALSGSDSHARVASSTGLTLILSASEGRTRASVFNHSSAGLYLSARPEVSVNFFDVKLSSGSYYELPSPVWRGAVYGVWDAANGWAMVTDMTGSAAHL